MEPTLVSPADLVTKLLGADELAVVDAREEGAFSAGHLFAAASLPLSQMELRIEALIPRRDTPVVWCDGGAADGGLAVRAAARAAELGWTAHHVLDGGVEAWAAAGHEVYTGVNVPSKAFGEILERDRNTPHMAPEELVARRDAGDALVVLDSRPFDEYRRMAIPGGVDCPGAELVARVRTAVPDPATTVVVNCAGRTRSILGAQSLIDAGVPNPVFALENGTMGWQLAGESVERGAGTTAPEADQAGAAWARDAAAAVGARHGVTDVDGATLATWLADTSRTTYLFDVRTPDEFAAGHLEHSRSAPGGQLIQATDTYAATRRARLVLIDDTGVRATMTAAWLRQMGWADVAVLDGGIDGPAPAAANLSVVGGAEGRPTVARVTATMIKPPALAERLADPDDALAVLDVGTSYKYGVKGHIPGSWWGVRGRLGEARAAIGATPTLVITSTDGTLAKLAVAEAQIHWPEADVYALAAGNKGWRHAGFDMEPGLDRATTTVDDAWVSPYAADDFEVAAQAYIDWEVGLVAQVDRDPLVTFTMG